MTYVIWEPSICVKDRSCVDGDACLPVVQVDVIYPGDNVPGD